MCLECVGQSREVVHALLHPGGKDPQTVVEVDQRQFRETDHLVVGEVLHANLSQSILKGGESIIEREQEVSQSLPLVEVLHSILHHRLKEGDKRRREGEENERTMNILICIENVDYAQYIGETGPQEMGWLGRLVLAVCMCVVEGGGPQFDHVAMDTRVDVGKLVKLLVMMPVLLQPMQRVSDLLVLYIM